MRAGSRIALWGWLLPCLLLCGCRSGNDLVESELRRKEMLYRDALAELKSAETRNEALQRELDAIRHAGPSPLPPEVAAPTFGLRRVVLGRGTGGYDNDSLPGDEALQVVVEPRDGDDHTVKVPGSLHVTAIEVNPQGLKRPLCWWSFTPEQLRPNWKQGLLSTGYTVILPWTVFPQCETVRVIAQFKLTDGRVFEADKDVKVRPLPVSARPAELPGPAPLPAGPAPWGAPPPNPVPPGPNPFVVPSGGIAPASDLRWSPAPIEGLVSIGRPQPLTGPTAPLPVAPVVPFTPVPRSLTDPD
jgi:hypothetical protein